jgi:hypothetical protein
MQKKIVSDSALQRACLGPETIRSLLFSGTNKKFTFMPGMF